MPRPSVAFISGDWNNQVSPPEANGCAYYRQVLPAAQLGRLGWEDVLVGQPVPNSEHGIGLQYQDGALYGFDTIQIKLIMHQSASQLIRLHQAKGQRVIVDVDDFHFSMHKENVAHAATDPHANPTNNRAHYEAGIRAADTVTVSTAFLADFYSRRCRDVRLIRNGIDAERFHVVTQPEKPTIGWLGGTMWRSGDLELLRDWLPQFVADHDIPVHHSGHIPSDPRHFGVRVGLRRVGTISMKPVSGVPQMLDPIHIGLVPLVRNDFNEAKSFLKGLEYAVAGIPFIATPTEEYRVFHEAGIGRLAETPDEWRDHATELLDPQVRVEEAIRQRRIAVEQFHIDRRGPEWDTAMSG
jgi:hypothetical protein